MRGMIVIALALIMLACAPKDKAQSDKELFVDAKLVPQGCIEPTFVKEGLPSCPQAEVIRYYCGTLYHVYGENEYVESGQKCYVFKSNTDTQNCTKTVCESWNN